MDINPPTILKTFKYNSSSYGTVLDHQTPLHYRSSSQTMISSNGIPITTFEDISFSSYLKPKDPKKHQENAAAVDDTEISIFDAQKYFSENTTDPRYTKKQQQQQQQDQPSPDNNNNNILRVSSVSSTDGYGRNFRTRSFNATPTASSEASWNSQTGLLANPPGSVGVSLRNFSSDHQKKRSSAKKWFSGRKCCCTGMNSVQVKEATSDSSEHGGESNNSNSNSNSNNGGKSNFSSYAKRDHAHKTAAPTMSSQRSSTTTDIMEDDFPTAEVPRQRRISATGRTFVDGAGGFSFPILNNTTSSAQVINTIKPVLMKGVNTKKTIIVNPMEDPPRDSLEVFQPIPVASRPPSMDISVSNRQHFNPGSPIPRVANTDDDMESDASSDLFEIESFSTQTTSYPMYRRRDSLDDEAPAFNARRFTSANSSIQYGRRSLDEPPTPSVAATECYAPSEVSIDWSVTTAEGYDRASVSNFSISASEMGSAAFLRQRLQHQAHEETTTVGVGGGGGGDNGKMRKGNGGGLMMMSCRQEKAVNVGPQPMKWVAAEGPPPPPQSMYPMMHVGGRPPRANKPPMGSDHSARLSLAFAA